MSQLEQKTKEPDYTDFLAPDLRKQGYRLTEQGHSLYLKKGGCVVKRWSEEVSVKKINRYARHHSKISNRGQNEVSVLR